MPPDNRFVPFMQRGLEHKPFVRRDHTLNHKLSQTVRTVDCDHVAKTRFRIERKHHSGSGQVRPHHGHDPDRERDFELRIALARSIADGAVREQRGKALVHGAEKPLFTPHVQKCLGGARKRRFRQVLRAGRGPHRQLGLAPQASNQRSIGLANGGPKIFRQRRLQYSRPRFRAFRCKLFQIFGIQFREERLEFSAQTLLGEQPPVAVGGDGESIQDANPLGFQRDEHLPERRVLAAHPRYVPHANLGKINRKSCLHRVLHPFPSRR